MHFLRPPINILGRNGVSQSFSMLKESHQPGSVAAIPLAKSILAGEEPSTFLWLSKVSSVELLPYALWGAAAGCKFNRPEVIAKYRSRLNKVGVESFAGAIEMINGMNYSPELTAALVNPLKDCSRVNQDELVMAVVPIATSREY